MKRGGSAALASMLRQRSEVIQSGGNPVPPTVAPIAAPEPLADGQQMPKSTHPAARALEEAKTTPAPPPPPSKPAPPPPAARAASPTPVVRAASSGGSDSRSTSPLMIGHAKRNFSPAPRATSPTPATAPAATGRAASPTPALRSTNAPAAAPRSVSPIAGLPKTISFSGANKCKICTKTVYKMEEIIAVGHVWHDKCFTCGGATDDGCKKVLRRDGYVDHGGEPFCEACYSRLYRPKGFSVSAGLNTDYGGASAPAPVQVSSAPPVAEVQKMKISTPTNVSKPAPPVSVASAPSAPVAPAAPSPMARAASGGTTALGGGNKCSICTKTVYKMEEILALGRVWHDQCFTCGATASADQAGCGKVLKRDSYVDHENHPYCQACYARLFGPKTFGFGIGHESTVANGSGPAATSSAPAAAAAPAVAVKPAPPAKPAPPPAPAAPAAPAKQPAAPGMSQAVAASSKVVIGGTSKASGSALYREAGYVGDNDEVDESEW